MTTLSVGCGKRKPEHDLIRLDVSPDVEPDLVWNLNKFPYPFEESSFCKIECFDVIEHLQEIPNTLEEFHRILKPNGLLQISTPHFSCANSFIDPTHRWHLSYFSFDYFTEGHNLSYYSKARYRIKNRRINFQGGRFKQHVLSRLANQFPQKYEQNWAWMFPAWFLVFELEAIK